MIGAIVFFPENLMTPMQIAWHSHCKQKPCVLIFVGEKHWKPSLHGHIWGKITASSTEDNEEGTCVNYQKNTTKITNKKLIKGKNKIKFTK